MAHIKVWLGVVLTLGLATLLWILPPQLNQKLQRQQPLLSPLAPNTALQKQLSLFTTKHIATLRKLSTHQGTRSALTTLAEKDADRRGKRHRKAHEAIRDSFKFFRGPQQNKRVYIFSHMGRLLFRTDAPTKYVEDEKTYSKLPFVLRAKQSKGKPIHAHGFWRVGGVPFMFSAVPILVGPKLLGIIMMSMKVERELLVELGIHPDTRKSDPLILIDSEKPLAMAIPKAIQGKTKAWVSQHFHTLSRQLQAGVFISPKAINIGGQRYSYLLAQFPVGITDSPIGYVLFTKLPSTKAPIADLERGPGSQWAALGAGGLAILLALWFTLGSVMTRRKLKRAVQQIADAPTQLQHVELVPSSFKALKPPLRILMNKAQNKNLPAAAPSIASMPSAAKEEPSQRGYASAPKSGGGLPPNSFAPGGPATGSPGPLAKGPGKGVKLPPSLLDPALGGDPSPMTPPPPSVASAPLPDMTAPGTPVPENDSAYKPEAPPLAAGRAPQPTAAPAAKDPGENNEELPDLSSELEKAFTSIQEDEIPFNEADPGGPGALGPGAAGAPPTNRRTLTYKQFDGDQLAAATDKIRKEKLQEIFQSYLNMRKKCGESTQGIQFAQFTERLDKQRETIIQQFSCNDVQFHIYEKSGRAAIKATPIK